MNEIDLYVNLIDEKEANEILKHYNINVKGDNRELKKIRLKAVLRGQLSGKKTKKEIDPFYQTYIRHKYEWLEGLTEGEFMVALREEGYGMPSYVKLANLLIYYPDKFKEVEPLIEENIGNGKEPFDLGIAFKSEVEVVRYIGKLSLLNQQKRFLHVIDRLVNKAVDYGFLKIDEQKLEEMRCGTLMDWQKYYEKEIENPFLYQYYYIKTHEDVDKTVFNSFAFEIMMGFIMLYSKNYKSNMSNEEMESKLSNYQKELNELNENFKRLEKESKDSEKKHKEVVSGIKKNLKQKDKEFDELNNKLMTEREDSKIRQNELKIKIADLEKLYKQEKKLRENYERNMVENEAYLKHTFSNDYGTKHIFGVISCMEISISKDIFKEILFIPYTNWKERIKDVEFVYIQREGISTGQLTKIKQYCTQNNISNKVINVRNEKDLIEQVSRFKMEFGGDF